jgi:MFS family permease
MPLKTFLSSRFPALASRDYAIFWVGQFLSLIGTWMQTTTQPYLAYRISGSPFDLGLIGMASTLPTFFLALPGGVLVERFDRRKTVIAMQAIMMVQAFILAILTLSGMIQIWHIILLSFLLGTASAIEITARQAMFVELVGKEALPNAIALQATIFNAARVIGPSLMAPFLIFIKGNGEGYAFLANAISYLIVIGSLFFVRTPFKIIREKTKINFIGDLKESWQYISSTRAVLMIILMAVVVGFIGFPMLQQIPVFARDVLAVAGEPEADIATRNSLIFTFQGIGALIAAFSLAAFNPKGKGKLLVAGQLIFTISIMLLAFSKFLPFTLAIFIMIGFGMVSTLATMNTLIQLEVPNEIRGRVFSAYLWGLQGVSPFGNLLIGWMASEWGVLVTTFAAGASILLLIGLIHLKTPEIRRIGT